MRKITYIILLTLFIFSLTSYGQRWKRTRYEFIYGIGYSNVFGDIGGGAGKGGNIATSIKDFDIQTVRPSIALGARYKLSEYFSFKLNLIYGYISAADKYSKEETRRDRGVSFTSPIFEQTLQGEFSIVKERYGRRYTISNIRGFKNLHINTYLLAGIGGAYFNPKSKENDIPITENNGQHHLSVGETYSKYTMVIPVGIGFKYGINRKLSFGIEYGNRFTMTDYLDNHKDINSKHKDSYMFMTFLISYKLRTTRSGLPKF